MVSLIEHRFLEVSFIQEEKDLHIATVRGEVGDGMKLEHNINAHGWKNRLCRICEAPNSRSNKRVRRLLRREAPPRENTWLMQRVPD
jgi:hypothetical protein